MCNLDAEAQHLVDIQRDIFRLAKKDYALSPKRLRALSGIPETTIASWANGVQMPAWAFARLCRHIPDELTSLLMEPAGKHVGTNPDDDGALDELAEEAAELVQEHVRARSPRSPGGVNIVPMEREALKHRGRRVCAKARAVAA